MDCQVLAQRLASPMTDRSAWVGTVTEIRAACNLMPQFRVMHVCREANTVAHELAKMGMQKRDCVVMHFSMLGEIRDLVQGEAVKSQGGSQACNSVSDD
jgi:hypothetical protein